MNLETPPRRLEKAVALSREMLRAAELGDWNELARLELERAACLTRIPAGPASAEGLREVLLLNEEITRCALISRDAAADAWTHRLRALRGANAYLDTARG